ncbi:TPA: hypothetical protein SMI40_002000 [Serratia liquefaciens]|jgi:hypothetical protein|uniref:Uncharacterized protein n=2 Tax=Serratia TaxID=613 RepID=A0ABX7CZE3_SERLI|nr:hypothetical protein [Serratia liquefaciens]QQU53927.1 hypothetical protein I6I38_16525 [Serratia liquefaciens]HCT9095933.1 hypothetical protein [Serratia liquefaciens]HEJ8022625.1 hypothetical protein [Serratia liquefaciens]
MFVCEDLITLIHGVNNMAIRELTSQDLDLISGGNADSGYEGRGDGRGHYGGAPNTCANKVGASLIAGVIEGVVIGAILRAGHPAAMIAGAVFGGIQAGISCADEGPSRGGRQDALGGNNSRNSVNGQCRW